MAKESAPICEECTEQITVRHILTNCAKYRPLLNKYNLNINMENTLEYSNVHKLKLFLEESELIKYI